MLVIKNIIIVFACILMSGACDKSEETTFKFLFPANETRKVDLEFQGQRTPLTFVPGDSLRVASVSHCFIRWGVRLFMGGRTFLSCLGRERKTLDSPV